MFWTVFAFFLTGLLFAGMISCYGFKLGFADVPNQRSSHVRVTPRGGGLGIPVAVFLAVIFVAKDLYCLVFAALVLSAAALVDDRLNLTVSVRFALEFILAFAMVAFYKYDMVFQANGIVAIVISLLIVFALAVVITGATNFFNFMDGIDGIAGFEAVISFGMLAYYTQYIKFNAPVFFISLSVMAATAGFLIFNFPRARVFMGDVGSVFIGFLFAVLAVFMADSFRDLLVLFSFQSIFYLDCVVTVIIRFLRRENIFEAHLMHLYQRLVHRKGWSHSKTALSYAGAQAVTGMAVLMLRQKNLYYLIVFYVLLVAFYIALRSKAGLLNAEPVYAEK